MSRRTLNHRASTLGEVLGRFTIHDDDPEDILRALVRPGHVVKVSCALPLWWDARRREGHTPESARMLLSLLVSSEMLAALDFGSDGHCPVLLL